MKVPPGRVDHGRWDDALDSDRVAIVAHWSDAARLSTSTRALLREFKEHDYRTVLVSTCISPEPLVTEPGLADVVVRRSNVAYDFGSWAAAMQMCPQLVVNRHVVLANDSLAGPFASLEGSLRHMESSGADVWGLVSSGQFGWHLQSFFLRFAPGVLSEPVVRRFWGSVKELGSKQRVINKYELGLSRLLVAEGYRVEAFLPAGSVSAYELNPMIMGWRGVLDAGVPLVKRELLRSPELVPDGGDVVGEVARRFGVVADDWA